MSEKQRKREKSFARVPEPARHVATPPPSIKTAAASEELNTREDPAPQVASVAVPLTPDVAQEPSVNTRTERRSVMAQSNETTIGSGITSTGTAIKDGVVGGLKGINEIGTGLVDLVGNTLSETLRATGVVAKDGLSVAKDMVTGTVQTVADVGAGLTTNVKNVARGVVTGVGEVSGDVGNVAQQAAKGVITGVADLGAMVGDVAGRAARGTVATAREVGGNVGGLARSTVEGTLEAADAIGGAAVKTVTHVLVSVVTGVKDVLSAALPRASASRE